MVAPSTQTLQRIASDTGHQASVLEKVIRLLDVLQEIARDRVLSERFVLKGGTALNVFHLGLDRLSVDIDLNYIGALDREVMEAERPEVEVALNRLVASQGYSVRRQPEEHAGGKWIMLFASALGGNATLELDVNYMARQPLFGAACMPSIALGGMRASDVLGSLISMKSSLANSLRSLTAMPRETCSMRVASCRLKGSTGRKSGRPFSHSAPVRAAIGEPFRSTPSRVIRRSFAKS